MAVLGFSRAGFFFPGMDAESIKARRIALKKQRVEQGEQGKRARGSSQAVSDVPIEPRAKKMRPESGKEVLVPPSPGAMTVTERAKGKVPLLWADAAEIVADEMLQPWAPDWSIRKGDSLTEGAMVIEVADKLVTPRDRQSMSNDTMEVAYMRLAQANVLACLEGAQVMKLHEKALAHERERANRYQREMKEMKIELEGSHKEQEVKAELASMESECVRKVSSLKKRFAMEKESLTTKAQDMIIDARNEVYEKALSHVRHFYPTIDLTDFDYDMVIELTPKTPEGGEQDQPPTAPAADPPLDQTDPEGKHIQEKQKRSVWLQFSIWWVIIVASITTNLALVSYICPTNKPQSEGRCWHEVMKTAVKQIRIHSSSRSRPITKEDSVINLSHGDPTMFEGFGSV